jgi:AraC-like DNA-binding protein
MYDRNTVDLRLLHMLPAYLERQKLSLEPLLLRAGLPHDAWDRPRTVAARAQICSLLLEAARRADDPALGLSLARGADPVRLGLSGQALIAGHTLRECLDGQARHMPSLQGGVRLHIEEKAGKIYWRHLLQDSDHEHARVLNEGVAAFMIAAVRRIAGATALPIKVMLPHRPQLPVRHYGDMLQAEVRFATSPCTVVAFDAPLLDRPNALLDATMSAAMHDVESVTEKSMPVHVADVSDCDLIENVNRVLAGRSLVGSPSLVDVARTLGYAPRTLQRRLGEFETSFEVILDTWRHQSALHYLAQEHIPVTSVARALGYSHTPHFIRAFWRWQGLSPTAYRRRRQGEAVVR